MGSNAKIEACDIGALEVVCYPDPRLREICTPVGQVDQKVRQLVERMFELMFAARGVGLAGPQVGVTVRIFVASPTFDPGDRRVYVNPQIVSAKGSQDGEEGCLSFPGISCKIKRAGIVTIRATNLDGQSFEETAEGLAARIFLHECDHLDGKLLVDRMGSVARLANRRGLKELEEQFASAGSGRAARPSNL